MKIRRNSLAWRWYQYWVSCGGRARNPENLCRFVRVLLIYAPVRWFLFADPPGALQIVLAMFLGVMTGVTYVHTYEVLFVGLVALLTCAFVTTIVLMCTLVEKIVKRFPVIRAYREARASKICPFIEPED